MTQTYVEPAPAALPAAVPVPLEEHTRIRWGAVFGGAVASLGIWALLYAFGLAIGLSGIDPNDPGSVRPSSIFTGIWSLITPIIALFIGGLIASRGAGAVTRGSGVMHGMVMWGLTTLIGAWAIANILSMIVGGAMDIGRTALGGAGGAAGDVAKSFKLDANEVLAPINERLTAEGKPTVRPEELEAATKDVLRQSVQQGRLDRDTLVASIAENTSLSQADAEEIAGRVEQQFQGAKAQLGQGARQAADVTGKALWGVFGALLLGLLASLGGGAAGASRKLLERDARARMRAYETVPVVRRPASAT